MTLHGKWNTGTTLSNNKEWFRNIYVDKPKSDWNHPIYTSTWIIWISHDLIYASWLDCLHTWCNSSQVFKRHGRLQEYSLNLNVKYQICSIHGTDRSKYLQCINQERGVKYILSIEVQAIISHKNEEKYKKWWEVDSLKFPCKTGIHHRCTHHICSLLGRGTM